MMKRQSLADLLVQLSDTYGVEALLDAKRLKGLLADLSASSSLEINLITVAVQLGIAEDIVRIRGSKLDRGTASRLLRRLQDEMGIAPDHAEWALTTLANALGKPMSEKKKITTSTSPDALDAMGSASVAVPVRTTPTIVKPRLLRNLTRRQGAFFGAAALLLIAAVVVVLSLYGGGGTDPRLSSNKIADNVPGSETGTEIDNNGTIDNSEQADEGRQAPPAMNEQDNELNVADGEGNETGEQSAELQQGTDTSVGDNASDVPTIDEGSGALPSSDGEGSVISPNMASASNITGSVVGNDNPSDSGKPSAAGSTSGASGQAQSQPPIAASSSGQGKPSTSTKPTTSTQTTQSADKKPSDLTSQQLDELDSKLNRAINNSQCCLITKQERETITALLKQGADPNYAGENGWTPLHSAVFSARAQIVELLIQYGGDVHKTTDNGSSAIDLTENIPTIKRLVAAGADINEKDRGGMSRLFHAALGERADDVKALLDMGADPNTSSDSLSALDVALDYKKLSPLLPMLLEAGADVNVVSDDGNTPLIRLVRFSDDSNVEQVKLLLKYGADVHHKYNGKTALEIAQDKGSTEIVNALRPYYD